MPLLKHFKILGFMWIFLAVIGLSVLCRNALAADNTTPANNHTNTVADAEGKAAENALIGTQEVLRSNLQIQAQLHDALLAVEKSRQEAEAASARNTELLDARLSLMEKTLTEQRAALADQRNAELRELDRSDRMMVIAAGGFAGLGFLVLLASAFLQWTGANRLAKLATALPLSHAAPMLSAGENPMVASQALEQSNARFLTLIEQLEKRVHSMEISGPAPSPQSLPEATPVDGVAGSLEGLEKALISTAKEPAVSPDGEKEEAIRVLLAKGQTHLKLDQPQAALDCFEEALVLDSAHPDALIKKGAALERLQRLDEAIECYDLALARDNSMTMAYLYKGGVFNRLERYSEALACYEQALKTQQKGHAANVIMD